MIKIIMQDNCNENSKIEYLVAEDEKYRRNIETLRNDIAYNYESYQEIEDFIYENFTIVDIKDITILF